MDIYQTTHQKQPVTIHNTNIKRLIRQVSGAKNRLDAARKQWKGTPEELDHQIELTRFRFLRGAKLSQKERLFYALLCQ